MLALPLLPEDTIVPADDEARPLLAGPMFTPWACGLDEPEEAGADRCTDIIPELMVELL